MHRIRLLVTFAAALALFTVALAVSPHGAARAATTPTVTYSIAAASAIPSFGSCDVGPCVVTAYSFTGTGIQSTYPLVPQTGQFTWIFQPSKVSNSNSCSPTQGTGTLSIIWQDNSTTDVTFTFKARDAHTWAIKGQVTASTNSFFPPTSVTPSDGVVGYPPNPCTGASSVPATISLFPPAPV